MSDSRTDQGGWQAGGPAAGWYPDPWDEHRRRYWDGRAWTGDVSFEPPGSWGEHSGTTQVSPAVQPSPAAGSPVQAHGGHWPQAVQSPGWGVPAAGYGAAGYGAVAPSGGGGGYGGHPQAPGWYGQPGWQGSPRQASPGSRIHVALVAIITVIAVFAGIGVGSQLNSSSGASATAPSGGTSGGTGSGGATNPFGGGGTTGGGTGSTTLTPAQKSLAATVDKSVVDINTELGYQNGAAAGTGMILTSNGTILTNNHVIDGATSLSVTVVSTGKTYKADVVGDDPTQDVAVVQMEDASGLTPISLDTGSDAARGDTVVAIGNAQGAGGTPSAVSGSVTGLGQSITASDENGSNAENLTGLIQTDAPIQPGDSGGPLVNAKGQVIGMDTAASSSGQVSGTSQGFAIPIGSAQQIAGQIEKGQATAKIHIGATGFLGVSVAAGQGTGLPGSIGSGNGASVSNVITGSPAAQAGIVGGDTITGVDGTQITSASDLTGALRSHHPNDQVSVTWIDAGGTAHTATITLTTGPAA